MTKVWDACDGGVWSISSKDHLSFDVKGAGSQDAWCLMGQAIGQEGEMMESGEEAGNLTAGC